MSSLAPSLPVVFVSLALGIGFIIGIVRGIRDLRRRWAARRLAPARPLKSPPPVQKGTAGKRSAPKAPPPKPSTPLPTSAPLSKDTPIEKTSAKSGGGRGGFWSVENQLNRVQAAGFSSKPVMNKSEYQVFLHVEELLQSRYRGCRLFAQVSLGEILGSDDQKAFSSINSKRIDMLIMGADGYPAVAIEYQGTGHYQGDAEMRDAIKREALERAGVPLVEIFPNDTGSSVQSKIAKAMKQRRGRS